MPFVGAGVDVVQSVPRPRAVLTRPAAPSIKSWHVFDHRREAEARGSALFTIRRPALKPKRCARIGAQRFPHLGTAGKGLLVGVLGHISLLHQ